MSKNNQHKELHSTIDIKHGEMLQHFQNIESTTIPALIQEKQRLKGQIATLREHQIDEYMDICDKIQSIKQQISSLKKEKKQYMVHI